MYQVIIIEDDPMVAAIDKQYVEADSQFRVVRTFKSGGEALAHLPGGAGLSCQAFPVPPLPSGAGPVPSGQAAAGAGARQHGPERH